MLRFSVHVWMLWSLYAGKHWILDMCYNQNIIENIYVLAYIAVSVA